MANREEIERAIKNCRSAADEVRKAKRETNAIRDPDIIVNLDSALLSIQTAEKELQDELNQC